MHIGLQILALAQAQVILAAMYSYIVSIVGERVGLELRARFFDRFMRRTAASDGERAGAKASEFVADLAIIQSAFGDTAVSFVRHVLFTLGALAAMFLVDFRMAFATLLGTALVAAVIIAFVAAMSRSLVRMQEKRAVVVGSLLEAAGNRYIIQAFRKEDYFRDLFDSTLRSAFLVIRRYQRFSVLMNPAAFVALSMAVAGIVVVGSKEVSVGRLEPADILAFLTYAVILVTAVSQIGMTAGQLRQAFLMFHKHEALLAVGIAVRQRYTSKSQQVSSVGIAFRFIDVNFTYPKCTNTALRSVNFSIPEKKTTALLGASGSGKSTVAAILLDLLHPQSGNIEKPTKCEGIAVVPQEPFLFRGTVSDNIRFGRSELSNEVIRSSAVMAQISDQVNQLSDGYSHVISEGGGNLSRGQQQRLALARAIAGGPSVLILDEATASLDVASERAIASALRGMRGETTIIIIAHQGSLIEDVDHLIVLDAGSVLYEGPPDAWPGKAHAAANTQSLSAA